MKVLRFKNTKEWASVITFTTWTVGNHVEHIPPHQRPVDIEPTLTPVIYPDEQTIEALQAKYPNGDFSAVELVDITIKETII